MRKFGLIGFPLGHSFSQNYFTSKFSREGITDCVYQNFPIENIDILRSLIAADPGLAGLNVTIPYKEKVLPFLDELTDLVRETGACNCIKISSNNLSGYNTDVIGFQRSLETKLKPSHSRALILGEGGAARAVRYVLGKMGIAATHVVRRGHPSPGRIHYSELNADIIGTHHLIVNTTPLGTHPNIDQAPPIDYELLTPAHYLFDLVYNPAKTKFLQHGEERGALIQNGYDMLVIQAEESWKIWNS